MCPRVPVCVCVVFSCKIQVYVPLNLPWPPWTLIKFTSIFFSRHFNCHISQNTCTSTAWCWMEAPHWSWHRPVWTPSAGINARWTRLVEATCWSDPWTRLAVEICWRNNFHMTKHISFKFYHANAYLQRMSIFFQPIYQFYSWYNLE